MTNDWPRVYDQAQAEIRDLRSQLGALERSATQIEDLKTKLETARAQLEAARADYAEADKDNYRLRQLLEAAQQERDATKADWEEAERQLGQAQREAIRWQAAFASPSVAEAVQALTAEVDAERTKREEAERIVDQFRRSGLGEEIRRADEAERRLGEVLAAGIELDAAAVALRLCTRWKTNEPEASVDRARRRWSAVLARQTEESG